MEMEAKKRGVAKEEKKNEEEVKPLELTTKSADLVSEKTYIAFAKEVSRTLYDGQLHNKIPDFFLRIMTKLADAGCSAEQLEKISSKATTELKKQEKVERD